MTVSTSIRKAGPFIGNGVTTVFPFAFKVFAKSDLRVILTDAAGVEQVLELDADYQVTLNADQDNSPGGNVTYTYGSPLPSTQKLTILSDVPVLQPVDIVNRGGFYPSVIENALDRATILAQQAAELLGRTLRFAVSDSASDTELPTAAERAGKAIVFDENGNIAVSDAGWQVEVSHGNVIRTTHTKGVGFVAGGTTLFLPSDGYIKENVHILFGGTGYSVELQQTAFSLNGATVTLASPIPADVEQIETWYIQPLAVGSINDGVVTDAKVAASAAIDANKLNFVQSGAGAAARSVRDKLRDTASVKDFGAKGDGIANDTTPILAAALVCLLLRKKLIFPAGTYLVDPMTIDNSVVAAWPTLEWEGEAFATGQALYQSGAASGAVIVTNGTNALQVNLDSFFNESVRIKNLSFYNKGARGATSAVTVTKTGTQYPRAWEFERIGYYNFDSCLTLQGGTTDLNTNYIGTLTVRENFPYDCGIGLRLADVYANLMSVQSSLYHGCAKGGIVFNAGAKALGSGGVITVRDTHFEGCEPAAILAGVYSSVLSLDSVSAEACGVLSGYGFLKRSTSIGALTVNAHNSGYGDKGFSLMPSEFRLGRGDEINASCPVNASGYGWRTNTPDMVTPVVSNNPAYNQSDKSTFCLAPMHTKEGGRAGPRCFDKFTGWNAAANLSYTSPASDELPDALRSRFVGVKAAGMAPIYNITDTYTAPADGFIYVSWLAGHSSIDNGFQPGSSVVIDGIDTVTVGNTFGPHTGAFVYVAPIKAGKTLGRTSFGHYQAPSFMTAAYVTFERTALSVADAACGHPRTLTTKGMAAAGGALNLVDYGDSATPFCLRVKLWMNGGQYGYAEYLIRGDGVLAANRVYTSVTSDLAAGVTVTTTGGVNTGLYDITVNNALGVPLTVTRQVEFLS